MLLTRFEQFYIGPSSPNVEGHVLSFLAKRNPFQFLYKTWCVRGCIHWRPYRSLHPVLISHTAWRQICDRAWLELIKYLNTFQANLNWFRISTVGLKVDGFDGNLLLVADEGLDVFRLISWFIILLFTFWFLIYTNLRISMRGWFRRMNSFSSLLIVRWMAGPAFSFVASNWFLPVVGPNLVVWAFVRSCGFLWAKVVLRGWRGRGRGRLEGRYRSKKLRSSGLRPGSFFFRYS